LVAFDQGATTALRRVAIDCESFGAIVCLVDLTGRALVLCNYAV